MLGNDLVDGGLDRVEIGEVHGSLSRFGAAASRLARELVERGLVAVEQDEAGRVGGQQAAELGADPAGGAGDERLLEAPGCAVPARPTKGASRGRERGRKPICRSYQGSACSSSMLKPWSSLT